MLRLVKTKEKTVRSGENYLFSPTFHQIYCSENCTESYFSEKNVKTSKKLYCKVESKVKSVAFGEN